MAMPLVAPKSEDVLAVIRRHASGVTLEQIEHELSPVPQRRMLLYTVTVMVEQRQIVTRGTERAPVYCVAESASPAGAQVAPPVTPAGASVAPRGAAVTPVVTSRGTGVAPAVKPSVAPVAPTVRPTVAPVPPVRQPLATQPPAAGLNPVAEPRLGATAIGVNQEQVNELVDLIVAAQIPPVAIKPYVRQAAAGLPNPNEFIAAVMAELARR